jgi:hypothetical protein
MPLSDGSFFTWDQSKAQAILQVIQNIIPSNFIISFGPVQKTMTQVPFTAAVVSGYDVNQVPSTTLEPAGYSEYFYLQPLVTAQNIVTPANIPIGASTRYWLVNGMQVTAPYFAHLQTQEAVIDVTGNISSVSCTDLNGTNAPSQSVAQASLQVTATLYGAQ